MIKAVLTLILAGASWDASAADSPDEPAATVSSEAPRGVDDPRGFVSARYDAYLRGGGEEVMHDPVFAYSDRLRDLFEAYEAWAAKHEDLVGSLDFDWWVNAQDWALADVQVTELGERAGRRIVSARFTNDGRPDEVRFHFVRQGSRWFLDDAVEGTGTGDGGWTLSTLLQERPE